MPKWSEEQKAKALTIAEAISISEAARQTGIPAGTIKRWRSEMNRTEPSEPNGPSKKIQQIAEQAVEEAKDEVKEYIADKAKKVADDILDMVQQAIIEAKAVIKKGPNDDEPKAGWLRAIIGAIAQGVEKHQLLTGKPTSRLEGQVNQVHEQRYHIIQEIISDPELAERIRENYRRRIRNGTGQE